MRVDVVLLPNSYTMGGIEEHVMQLAGGLVRRGCRVAAICSPQEALRPMRDGLAEAGVRVFEIPERGQSLLAAGHRLAAMVDCMRQYRDGVLHLHFSGHVGGTLPVLAARLAGVRAIVRTDHNPPGRRVPRRERTLVHAQDMLLKRLLFVSGQVKRAHIEGLGRDPSKCTVVFNGVDTAYFSPHRAAPDVVASFGVEASTPIVGTVSRLAEAYKGMPYFVDMAAKLQATCPAARFVIVGDGPLRPELEHQAERLGIASRVIFAGRIPDLRPVLAAMKVFVLPSLAEGGPISLLEAMAMETPVVATPVGMVPEIILDGVNGRVVNASGDSDALARAVADLLMDPESAARQGRKGREVVIARASVDAMVDGVLAVYTEVCQ